MGLNYRKLISSIVDKQIREEEIPNFRWKAIHGIISNSKYLNNHGAEGLTDFLLHVQKRGNFLEQTLTINQSEHYYMSGLIKMYERNRQWKRDFKKWKPKSHNKNRQFRELLFHLFGTYEVPKFMDNVWFRRDKGSYKYREWYIKLTNGESLRKQKFKIPITKKIAHYFGQAPEDYSIEQAVTYGIIHSEGGNERLVKEFIATKPSNFYQDLNFWKTFIRFLIGNPMIDKKMIGPIIDFVNHQKFDNSDTFRDGEVVSLPPPQPNFSFNNRNPNTLISLVEKWHGNIKKSGIKELLKFETSKIKGYLKKMKDKSSIQIKQLTSNFALYDEGEQLGHCVGSYAYSCFEGRCTIWSYSKIEDSESKKQLTIEINKDNTISEIRGSYNRFPSKSEMSHIQRWSQVENLSISKWIIDGIE